MGLSTYRLPIPHFRGFAGNSMERSYKTYFAGALFKLGDLAGNILLADALGRVSGGDFVCVLPQDFEVREPGPGSVRDADLKLLLDCDCALFNFDGLELDSGTLAEFMFAKSIDMPCAILRSDFRGGGDQGPGGEPWNLMCSFHPRSEVALFHSLTSYKGLLKRQAANICGSLAEEAAKPAVAALRKAVASVPLDKGGPEGAKLILNWAVRSRGESFERLCSADPAFPDALLERKLSRKLI